MYGGRIEKEGSGEGAGVKNGMEWNGMELGAKQRADQRIRGKRGKLLG